MLPLLLSLESGCGGVGYVTARRGRTGVARRVLARCGEATVADGSTEGPGSPCRHQAVEARSDAVRHGEARQDAVWFGKRKGRFGALFALFLFCFFY